MAGCLVCNKELKSPQAIADGMGAICKSKLKNMGGQKVSTSSVILLIGTDSPLEVRRAYSVYVEGSGKQMVKLYKQDADWFADCGCGIDNCEHIQAVRNVIKKGN